MIECATRRKAGLVIVSRDSDYGATIDGVSYINDHLRQEFSERVSRTRKLALYSRLSDALKRFNIEVSAQEEESENELLTDVEDRKNPNSAPLSALSVMLSGESSLSARTPGLERLEALRKILAKGTEEPS